MIKINLEVEINQKELSLDLVVLVLQVFNDVHL